MGQARFQELGVDHFIPDGAIGQGAPVNVFSDLSKLQGDQFSPDLLRVVISCLPPPGFTAFRGIDTYITDVPSICENDGIPIHHPLDQKGAFRIL